MNKEQLLVIGLKPCKCGGPIFLEDKLCLGCEVTELWRKRQKHDTKN